MKSEIVFVATMLIIAGMATAEYQFGQDHHSAHEEFFDHPNYSFEYSVNDPHTGDSKSHEEHRDGDTVIGKYELDEPDGTRRIVEYTADKHNGFNAVVKKVGIPHHVEKQQLAPKEHSDEHFPSYTTLEHQL